MDPLVLKKLNAERAARRAAIVVTDLGDGRDRLVKEGETVAGELGEAVRKAFLTGKAATAEVSGREFFINPHLPPVRIVVIGAVHISQALVPVAAAAGYALEIIDPRTAFATPERFPGVPLAAEWPQDVLEKAPLDRYAALVAVTHDPKIDDWPIMHALQKNCFYVGALGSRKTNGRRRERLAAEGVSEEQLDRIAAPIGLDIGAASPGEIAVAIMAQIIASFRSREGLA